MSATWMMTQLGKNFSVSALNNYTIIQLKCNLIDIYVGSFRYKSIRIVLLLLLIILLFTKFQLFSIIMHLVFYCCQSMPIWI